MPALYYDIEELKKLVDGAGVSSEVHRRVEEAIKNNPHFKGKPMDAVKQALKRRGLLEGITVDNQGLLLTWPDELIEEFKKDYVDTNISKPQLVKKYKKHGIKNSDHAYKIAKRLDVGTERGAPESNWSEQKKQTFKKDYENPDVSMDEIVKKNKLKNATNAWNLGKRMEVKRPQSGPTSWSKEKQDEFTADYANPEILTDEIMEKYGMNNMSKVYRAAKYFHVSRPKTIGTKQWHVISGKVIDRKALEHIERGILATENGYDNLHEKLVKKFPNNKFDKRKFKKWIYKLLFVKQKSIDANLQEIVRNTTGADIDASIEKIVKALKTIYPFIPGELIEKRVKWHKGLVRGRGKDLMGKSMPGIGRIDLSGGTSDYEPPRSPFKNPVVLTTKDPLNWSILILNGANLGIKHGPDIVGNVARQALSDAEARKDDRIVLTNFLCFDLKKAGGPAKTARALIMGDNINPELVQDKDYRQVVERIIRDNPMDEVAYRTPEELVNDVLGSGWGRVCIKPKEGSPNGKEEPEYSGPIYIAIGLNELALIFAVTYWEIRWWTLKKQKELRTDMGVLKKALTQAKKELSKDEHNRDAYNNVARINRELESLTYQLTITTVSNVANQESQRFFNHAYGVVVSKIEHAIPNSKVIGEGTSYLNVNGKMVEIHIPSHMRVTDSLLHNYCSSYGPKTLRENVADYTLICHPFALNYQATGRETDHDGKRDSMGVCVAPIAIDDKYLRSRISTLRRKDHPIVKAIYTETFRSGVVRLRSSNGVLGADDVPFHALESFKNYPEIIVEPDTKIIGSAVYNRGPKYMWFMNASDQHWGGRSKEFVWDKVKGVRRDMAGAIFEMMRREGLFEGNKMPVHFFCTPDDPVQGQNHKYRTEPHPREVPYQMIEKITGDLLYKIQSSKKGQEKDELAEEIRKICLFQFEKRGADYIFNQMMQMMERHIGENVDAFSAILRRARSANIKIQGVGELSYEEYGTYDSRNIGLINIGTGDRHFSKSVDFELIEGPFYAMRLRDLLLSRDEWKGQLEFLNRMVVSPIYGQTCIGWGVISVEGKHQYGIEIRSAPSNMSGWGHPLRGHVKKDLQRGNYSRIWNDKLPILKFFGDKHFFSAESTSYSIYHMSPAAVHTDAYGEHGFPPNNTGVSFMGVPEDGPESGPILWRVMPFDVIKDFMEDNPRFFDWTEYLPNPA